MAPNYHQPHLLVLPEDDADGDLANGFHLELSAQVLRKMQVLPAAGGWHRVLDTFRADHVSQMEKYPHQFMVLLIDFDAHEGRMTTAKARIPEHLSDRVFVLGAWTEPEQLRSQLGWTYERIGRSLAEECRQGNNSIWAHDLLRHNTHEIERLRVHVRPFLFE